MNLKKIILIFTSAIAIYSCADYKTYENNQKSEKQYFSSSGFALIYDDDLFKKKIIRKKINNEELRVMHSLLKTNTPIKIINPENSKFIETKIYKKTDYPKIFNVVISKKIASILELDVNNPYVEVFETKKNKIFIAKKTKTFEEERNVAEKIPLDEIKVDDLSINKKKNTEKILKKNSFVLVINDFYYEVSAQSLKKELINKTNMNNIYIKKINNKKYRLLAGPFEDFNALKTSYISLNNLGFENLNIYKN